MREQAHFGFEAVTREEKRQRVMGVFSSVAGKYDLMNDLMSLGLHRLWKRCMLARTVLREGSRILDVAAGSGDIALGLAKRMRGGRLVLVDPNESMLRTGSRRMVDAGLLPGRADCIRAEGGNLPFKDRCFDVVTVAFGIRNFPDVQEGLKEFFRVLRPGGQFVCLEFSRPCSSLLDMVYDTYSFNMIPLLGELVVGDRASYQYLVESIRRFPDQERFARMIEEAGFSLVRFENMSGGIVALHRGYRISS